MNFMDKVNEKLYTRLGTVLTQVVSMAVLVVVMHFGSARYFDGIAHFVFMVGYCYAVLAFGDVIPDFLAHSAKNKQYKKNEESTRAQHDVGISATDGQARRKRLPWNWSKILMTALQLFFGLGVAYMGAMSFK